MEDKIEKIKAETDFFAKAKLIQDLIEKENLRIVDIARKLEINSSYVCHLLRLNRLPAMIVDGYYANMITISHLFIVSRIKDEKKLKEIYERILSDSLTVGQTDELVREVLYQTKTTGNRITGDELANYVDKLKSSYKDLQTKVIQTRIKGKIILEIKGSLQDSSEILKKILEKLTK